MHFWIDKRSQAFGRPRVSASLSHGNGIGFNPNNRRLRGKSMVTPIHRYPAPRQSQASTAHQPANHVTPAQIHSVPSSIQQQQINNQVNLQRQQHQFQQSQHHQPVSAAAQIHQHHPNYHQMPVNVHNIYESQMNELEIDHGSIEINTIPRPHMTSADIMGSHDSQLLPTHLKCGMWASLALATVFVAGAKFYFDHQGTGLEVLIFCAFCATFFLTACGVSLCRRPRDLSLSPNMGIDQLSISDQNSLQHNNELINHSTAVVINPPTGNVIIAPPPPYHIAILLPENIKEVEELPPPSYDKIVI